jgi:tetratricopeptide (TPR) repeat protein
MLKWVFIGVTVWLAIVADIAADQSTTARLQAPCETWVGKMVSLQGEAFIMRRQNTQWQPAFMNELFCSGDRLRISANSRAAVVLRNDALLRLDQNSTLTFNGIEAPRTFLIDLLRGTAYFFSREARSLKLTTPFMNGVVKGTEFLVRVDDASTLISLFEGSIQADNEMGDLLLSGGQSAVAYAGRSPQMEIVARPRDAVQWALYYPPIVAFAPDEFEAALPDAWQTQVGRSIDDYRQGNPGQALNRLEGVSDQVDDPRFFVYRAGLALAVGRAIEASQDIDRALARDENHNLALALRSIMAVAQNRKEDAIIDARQAVLADPRSAAARIALSYALQAFFDIENALKEVQTAVEVEPQNGIAWARLAELRLSSGDLKRALSAARNAVTFDPQLARTQTVLGFAYLTRIETEEARTAFGKAIELDSTAPLPRLGLGLAMIRQGELEAGRTEIEIAAGLDPGNALIRSYLGKAYFDEKRAPLDGRQLEIAKTLDPRDPTPWFYDAIRKQTLNRPAEALWDLQKSIELNDHRAVYRSRLLLDEDLAARSASLGRIYNTLGFSQRGLFEGYRSVNTDPGDFSAHRFLADSYAGMPRMEMARVSELLRSQLLQPLNVNPIPPLLAETDITGLEAAGPASASFNEFNPLFLRDRLTLQLSALGGSNSTYGNELIHSGVLGRYSYSLGQFRYQTDGYRENNDVHNDILTAYGQTSLTPDTSIQTEVRYRQKEKGDLGLRFDQDYSTSFREEEIGRIFRLGGNHYLSPDSVLLGSLIWQSINIDQEEREFELLERLDSRSDREGYQVEFQNILTKGGFNVTSGVGHIDHEDKTSIVGTTAPMVIPLPPPLPPIIVDPMEIEFTDQTEHFRNTNLYVYSQIKPHQDFIATLGLSADFFRYGDLIEEDQLNPKLGFMWQVLENASLRGAAFRTRSKTLAFAQTIEPTQVAGFNQFYDDIFGSDIWLYGGAIDLKLSDTITSGFGYTERDLRVPVFGGDDVVSEEKWKEKIARVYLYWIPHPRVALSAEYFNEWFDIAPGIPEGIITVRTHRTPLAIRFFHPTGISAQLKGTYIDQSGEFQQRNAFDTVSGHDSFWVFDAAIEYRLPERYGYLALGIKNLFDEDFAIQDFNPQLTSPANPMASPERFAYVTVTLAF